MSCGFHRSIESIDQRKQLMEITNYSGLATDSLSAVELSHSRKPKSWTVNPPHWELAGVVWTHGKNANRTLLYQGITEKSIQDEFRSRHEAHWRDYISKAGWETPWCLPGRGGEGGYRDCCPRDPDPRKSSRSWMDEWSSKSPWCSSVHQQINGHLVKFCSCSEDKDGFHSSSYMQGGLRKTMLPRRSINAWTVNAECLKNGLLNKKSFSQTSL